MFVVGEVAGDRLRQGEEGRSMSKRGIWKNLSDGRTVRQQQIPRDQQWTWWTIEMLESPAARALKGAEFHVINRIRIELAHHGGQDNGKLPVTFRDFHKYGIHWDLMAPSIRAAEALGFIRVMQRGVASAADFHVPTLFALTHLPTDDGKTAATEDWRKIATLKDAKAIAKAARKAPAQHSRLPKRRRTKTEIHSGKPERTHSGKPERKLQFFRSGKPEHCLTPDSGALSISRGGGGGSGGESTLEPVKASGVAPGVPEPDEPLPGIGHNNGPPLAPNDSLTIPTFLLRGHADCVLGSS
jgi:hypothetical protein